MTRVVELAGWHVLLAALPVIAGAIVAVLAAVAIRALNDHAGGRSRWAVALRVLVGGLGALPIAAVWVILPMITGQPLMRTAHLEVALTLVVAAMVLPPLAERDPDRQAGRAARALGVAWWRRGIRTLRNWSPALGRGLAPAWVAAVTGVTVAALMSDAASNGLGALLAQGWRAGNGLPVLTGTVLVMLIAAVGDVLIRLVARRAATTGHRPMAEAVR